MNANLTHDATAACGATLIENAAPGALFAKRWRRDGTCQDYDRARLVNLRAVPLRDLDALAELLARLGTRPRLCLVRAAIADPARVRRVRRLLHTDPENGEAPTLRDVPRRWVALDVDNVPLPAGIDPRNLEACARRVLALLPPRVPWSAVRCAGHGRARHQAWREAASLVLAVAADDGQRTRRLARGLSR
jgi:hypothetical protein